MALKPHSSSPATNYTFSIKLNATNYLAWGTQFIPLLNYQDLHGFVDGTSALPQFLASEWEEKVEPNPEYDKWFKKDQMLLTWILFSLTKEVFPYITGLASSFDA